MRFPVILLLVCLPLTNTHDPPNTPFKAVELVLSRARSVEKCVYNDNGDYTSTQYKQKIRTLFVNLKDKSNPGLRETVVSGDLSVEKFTSMSSQVSSLSLTLVDAYTGR